MRIRIDLCICMNTIKEELAKYIVMLLAGETELQKNIILSMITTFYVQ